MIKNFFKDKNAKPTELGINKATKEPIVLKKGRFGPYLQSGKKMKSIPPGINESNITESIAEDVINMPYEIGKHPETNEPIIKDIGRYGPYIKCGSKNRKVSEPDNILNLSLDRAAELINQDVSATAVLKELGEYDGKKIIVKNGRYGIYVTNGKVNVTLPKDNDYNTLDLDTAVNMIKNKKPKKKFFKRK